jgi:hypothetical protein
VTLLRRWWPVLLLALAVLGSAWYINHLRGRVQDAEVARDQAALRAAGASAVLQATNAELRATVAQLERENAGLEAEVDRIRRALPGAEVVGTASGSTGPLPLPAGTLVLAPPSSPGSPQGAAAATPCLLTPGDRLELVLAAVALEGESGQAAVAATMRAMRHPAGGGEPVLLVEGPAKLDLKLRSQARSAGIGVGAVLVGGRSGWWVGPLFSPTPFRLWSLEGSVLLGAGAGPGGDWGALAGTLVRW